MTTSYRIANYRKMALVFTLSLAACASEGNLHAATLLVVNGHIYIGNKEKSWAEALVAEDGRIIAVGTNAEAEEIAGKDAQRLDLKNSTVIPGIVDSHLHPLHGALALHGLNLSRPDASVWPDQDEELIARLRHYAAENPTEKLLLVRANFDEEGPGMPGYELLDRAISDRPVIVHHVGEHSLWLNSRALELARVTKTPLADPAEEAGVERHSDGRPTGVLREAAMSRANQMMLQLFSPKQLEAMVREGLRYLNTQGITSAVAATGDLDELKIYDALRKSGDLTVRLRVAFGAVGVPHRQAGKFFDDLEIARKRYNDSWLSANLVKFFGVLHGKDSVYSPQVFGDLVNELDKRGFQVMTHAIDPTDINLVLNSYEQVIKRNGPRDRRLRIEHAFLIAADDVKRFGQLGIVASLQPTICCTVEVPGEPVQNPTRTLLDSNSHIAFGSDWPVIFPPNPMRAIAQAVTRDAWQGRQGIGAAQAGNRLAGEINAPAERMSVAEAVDAYNAGGAYASFRENEIGTLEVGKFADFVVLSQNIFAVPPADIASTAISKTIVGGKVVFDAALTQ
jgi:predicted amidohydrolase YtcJ